MRKNKTLYVSKEDGWEPCLSEKVTALITVGNLESIEIYGSSNGHINNIKADIFKTIIHGSGNLNLQGNTKKLKLDVYGSGEIKAKSLIAEDVNVSIYGSGYIVTNAIQKIDINIHGSGAVEYYGNPCNVNQTFNGSGKIKVMK